MDTIRNEESVNQVRMAYVVFRSMEGRQRALRLFKNNCFTWLFCCFRKGIKLKGASLTVRNAVDPQFLIWENFVLTKQ